MLDLDRLSISAGQINLRDAEEIERAITEFVLTSTPTDGAAPCIAANWAGPEDMAGSRSTAARNADKAAVIEAIRARGFYALQKWWVDLDVQRVVGGSSRADHRASRDTLEPLDFDPLFDRSDQPKYRR